MTPMNTPHVLGVVTFWIMLAGAGFFLSSDRAGAQSPEDMSTPSQREATAQGLVSLPTGGAALETDLSRDLVDIDTDFSGADLLLFGSVKAGTDIVIVVRGPPADAVIHRKQRRFGIWVNGEAQEYTGVPTYYHLAANRRVSAFVSPQDQQRFKFDLAALKAAPGPMADHAHGEPIAAGPDPETDSGPVDFEQPLIEDMKTRGFYSQSEDGVVFVGAQLFRMHVGLPADVPVGRFTVDIYAFRDEILRDRRSADFFVGKIGIGAALYSFAHDHPFLYGLAAVVMAIGLGGLSAAAFRTV